MRHVGIEGFTHGLTVVPGFGHGQQLEVGFDAVGDLQQDVRALLHRSLAPGVGGGMRGVQRLVDVGSVGTGEFADHRAIDWAGVAEVLAAERSDELTADVVAVAWFEGDDGACGTRFRVNHDADLSCCRSPLPIGEASHGSILGSPRKPRYAPMA